MLDGSRNGLRRHATADESDAFERVMRDVGGSEPPLIPKHKHQNRTQASRWTFVVMEANATVGRSGQLCAVLVDRHES